MQTNKPLGMIAYGSIPHLPGSRMGPGDHHCHEGQFNICCVKPRDKHDRIIVQEKLDGSCMSVAKINGEIVPLTRAGYPARSSKYEQHHMFHDWVVSRRLQFDALLNDGERACGEWLAQAHGTRYEINFAPFILFDIMTGIKRVTHEESAARAWRNEFPTPRVLRLFGPFSIIEAMKELSRPYRPMLDYPLAIDPHEGAIWRVERNGEVDFLAKYVHPDKVDGCYLPIVTGLPPVWNWRL